MPLRSTLRRVTCVAAIVSLTAQLALACPFCSAPSLTFSEQIAEAELAVIALWESGEAPDRINESSGSTLLNPQLCLNKNDQPLDLDELISINRYLSGDSKSSFLALGDRAENSTRWQTTIELSPACRDYITEAPAIDADSRKRLAYYIRFLEHSEQLIAIDAYSEFANASYQQVADIRDLMSREKLRSWLESAETTPGRDARVGLYGLMIGLCGNQRDAEFLRTEILSTTETRLGFNGLVAGYLILSGQDGLNVINQEIIANEHVEFSQRFAVMESLRFLWDYKQNQISKNELRRSLRMMLMEPQLTGLVVTDLARWKDWSSLEQIVRLYDRPDYDDLDTKRTIVRYLIAASNSQDVDVQADADRHLSKIRISDPKIIASAKRYYIE